jgi:hypothetical protein
MELAGNGEQVSDYGGFCPVNVVAGFPREEGTMAAIAGLNEADVRICE